MNSKDSSYPEAKETALGVRKGDTGYNELSQ